MSKGMNASTYSKVGLCAIIKLKALEKGKTSFPSGKHRELIRQAKLIDKNCLKKSRAELIALVDKNPNVSWGSYSTFAAL